MNRFMTLMAYLIVIIVCINNANQDTFISEDYSFLWYFIAIGWIKAAYDYYKESKK